jgi:hypothetical protein
MTRGGLKNGWGRGITGTGGFSMRRLLALFTLPLPLAALVPLAACSGGSSSTTAGDASPGDAGEMSDGPVTPPPTAACQGDPTACLSGTVDGSRVAAAPTHAHANLYRVFPSGGAMPVATQLVAVDGTWAFSAVPAWAHYYVQITTNYAVGGAQPATITTLAGPLTVPSTGGPVGVKVKPVQLQVFESRAAGGTMQVQWASAEVFDPATGDKLMDAQVAITAGGTTTPMPWGQDLSGHAAYFVQFATPPAAQATYTVTTSSSALGASPITWSLTADPPAFDGSITAPASGATVPVGKALTVSWSAQPSDFEQVELFFGGSGAGGPWMGAWSSASPDAQDTTQEPVPGSALGQAGAYLLNVAYTKASCPLTADGCVYASAVASEQLTAK